MFNVAEIALDEFCSRRRVFQCGVVGNGIEVRPVRVLTKLIQPSSEPLWGLGMRGRAAFGHGLPATGNAFKEGRGELLDGLTHCVGW